MSRAKTTAKSAARKKPAKVPQPHGGALNAGGTPGNKGGGRPKDEFKALCRELASGAKTVEQVKGILDDAFHPQFLPALRWATENGYGKATEHVEHSGKLEHEHKGSIKFAGMEIPL